MSSMQNQLMKEKMPEKKTSLPRLFKHPIKNNHTLFTSKSLVK